MHLHNANGSTAYTSGTPGNTVLPGTFVNAAAYTTDASSLTAMGGAAIATAGTGQPHDNHQPSLALNFCIALTGLFPCRS